MAVAGHTVSVSSASSPTSVPGPTVNSLPSGGDARLQQQRAFLHEIAAVGEFAGVEQHRAALQLPRLGADRENAQRLLAEHREGRHLFEEGDVVFEAHGYHPSFRERTRAEICAAPHLWIPARGMTG